MRKIWFVVAAMMLVATRGIAFAEDAADPAAVKSEDGKYLDKEGIPTFKVGADGTVLLGDPFKYNAGNIDQFNF